MIKNAPSFLTFATHPLKITFCEEYSEEQWENYIQKEREKLICREYIFKYVYFAFCTIGIC